MAPRKRPARRQRLGSGWRRQRRAGSPGGSRKGGNRGRRSPARRRGSAYGLPLAGGRRRRAPGRRHHPWARAQPARQADEDAAAAALSGCGRRLARAAACRISRPAGRALPGGGASGGGEPTGGRRRSPRPLHHARRRPGRERAAGKRPGSRRLLLPRARALRRSAAVPPGQTADAGNPPGGDGPGHQRARRRGGAAVPGRLSPGGPALPRVTHLCSYWRRREPPFGCLSAASCARPGPAGGCCSWLARRPNGGLGGAAAAAVAVLFVAPLPADVTTPGAGGGLANHRAAWLGNREPRRRRLLLLLRRRRLLETRGTAGRLLKGTPPPFASLPPSPPPRQPSEGYIERALLFALSLSLSPKLSGLGSVTLAGRGEEGRRGRVRRRASERARRRSRGGCQSSSPRQLFFPLPTFKIHFALAVREKRRRFLI